MHSYREVDQEYMEIDQELLERIKGDAWSIQNMEAHGADGRSIEYIGSSTEGHLIYDYYLDEEGAFWFGNRALLSGQIVSMDKFIFGREMKRNIYYEGEKRIYEKHR